MMVKNIGPSSSSTPSSNDSNGSSSPAPATPPTTPSKIPPAAPTRTSTRIPRTCIDHLIPEFPDDTLPPYAVVKAAHLKARLAIVKGRLAQVVPSASTPPTPAAPAAPVTPASLKSPPVDLKEITALEPFDKSIIFESQIVTADLEALITKEGFNQVYMAAWYNGSKHSIFDITQHKNDSTTMLQQFWLDLIGNNSGKIVYFHNWAGYDAILSMTSLLNLPGFTFEPIINHGEILSLSVYNNKNNKKILALTIKDSIRVLPGALAKLAKDYQVEQQKDHFPHYFNPLELGSDLTYIGPIPPYSYFEPKRTSPSDYAAMQEEFSTKPWSFLEVSKQYILGDCISLYQILITFFESLRGQFSIIPLRSLSAPSLAFKIWRTQQLPLLHKEGNLKVYDLSRRLDSELRKAYLGGIVDVYRPHLIGTGYYYDVNSLYPTAMCEPLPVGLPTPINLSINEFLKGDFFGFIEATVQAPPHNTPAGYIGLLAIRHEGRLICPNLIIKDGLKGIAK